MSARAVLLWNPASARGRGARLLERARTLLAQRGIEVDARATQGPGDAIAMAETAAREGAALILALGGDGTHGEVANGVLRSGARPRVALLPGGTGNDLLAHFGVTRLEDAIERVASDAETQMDVGRARWSGGGRDFLSMFGTGFVSDALRAASELRPLGRAAYLAAVPRALRLLRAVPTCLVLDGREFHERFSLVAVCNTSRAGGGMRFAPDAHATDGTLEIVALRDASRGRVLALLPKLLRGTHLGEPEVFSARASELVIETDPSVGMQADGELLGASARFEVAVVPRALRLAL